MKKVIIEHEVKSLWDEDLKEGDYIDYDGVIYRFDGYEYGTYPIATNIKTGEQEQLPH